jgi:hypothetical protein
MVTPNEPLDVSQLESFIKKLQFTGKYDEAIRKGAIQPMPEEEYIKMMDKIEKDGTN